jgi:hypothetical protein
MANMRSRLQSGNVLGRVRTALKASHKRYYLAPRENPHGVPKLVLKELQLQTLAGDQRPYDLRLQQLLTIHQLNKGG